VASGEWCRLLAIRGSDRQSWWIQLQWSLGARDSSSEYWRCKGLFLKLWFTKYAEALCPAAVTLGSPSDNTTPRCQRVARWWFFVFTKLSLCCIGCCREGRAGRDAEATSEPAAFFRLHVLFRKPGNRAIFSAACSWAPGSTKLADSSEPIVPSSPNRPAVPNARCRLHRKLHRTNRTFIFWCGQPI